MNRHREDFASMRRRKPVIPVIATVLFGVLLGAAHYFRIPLSDKVFTFDFALVYILAGMASSVLVIGWLAWLWFFSGWSGFWSRLVPLLTILALIAVLVCFRPIFRGGLFPDRWQPRFWHTRVLETVDQNQAVAWSDADPLQFPQFLGPRRNGTVDQFTGDLVQLIDAERLWKKPIGEGWSGFVAHGGMAWTAHQDGEFESVICLEIESGDLMWDYRHARRHDDTLGGAGPRATPTLDDGRLYAQGANGLLVCLDASNGQLLWQQDISELVGVSLIADTTPAGLAFQVEDSKLTWGHAGSPLIEGDLVIVPGGGPRDGDQYSLIAFDKFTGIEQWRAGDEAIGYSSPVVLTLDGVRQFVIVNENCVTGHDLAGKTLWGFPWEGHSDSDASTSQSIQVGDNRVLVSKGYGVGGALFEINRTGSGTWDVAPVWQNVRVLKTKLTSPVVRDELAWALSDGILECVDLTNGQRIWKRGRYGHGQLLLIGEYLLVHSERGFLTVVPATREGLRELDRVDTIDGVCWNTLAVYDNFVLVRSDLEAACFRLPRPGQRTTVDTLPDSGSSDIVPGSDIVTDPANDDAVVPDESNDE